MTINFVSELDAASHAVASFIQTIPDTALDQQVDTDAWSVKQVIAHLALSHNVYMMIVTLAKENHFVEVLLSPSLSGWQQVRATNEQVLACTTSAAAANIFQDTFAQLRAMLISVTSQDLDRPFQMYELETTTAQITTLRQRVIQTATEHMYEHLAQIQSSLAANQGTQA
ncbi:MAG TPA: DinB family protein [Nitrososphaera sp.]|nr:DinB family protein [Nitrososphaera sp.]